VKTFSIEELLSADATKMAALRALAGLALPDAWLAAGFVRNFVWDALHGYPPTPLNDLDVIVSDSQDSEGVRGREAQAELLNQLQEHQWQVTSQALMHLRNGDRPYLDCADAMSFWPEIETASGARINRADGIEVNAPFGLDSLMAGRITANPKRAREIFLDRVRSKRWLQQWPRLELTDPRAAQALKSMDKKSP